jgi:lipoprotein NlpI
MQLSKWIGAVFLAGCALAAPGPTECKGPAELERVIATQPSSNAYAALGAYFAQHEQMPCAISAFESALRLDSGAWQTHYNLALALLKKGERNRAVA